MARSSTKTTNTHTGNTRTSTAPVLQAARPAHLALTPDALVMMDTIARSGSFAAAARELGKVPSALTYSVRQLEEQLDVLLFDRRSGQAELTAAGAELLSEGQRLLGEMEGVANRVRRVATGWEGQLTIAVDDVISRRTVLDLCEAFYALNPQGKGSSSGGGPGTRLRLRTEVLAGTWEALTSGRADLAIGVGAGGTPPSGVALETMGDMPFVFVVASSHPLARAGPGLASSARAALSGTGARSGEAAISEAELLRHRAVAVADSAQRLSPITVNLVPGQEVLTVSSMADKLGAIERGLGVGWVPQGLAREALASGRLVLRKTQRPHASARLAYAWRCATTASGRARKGAVTGLALQWWLQQLASPATRHALLHA